MEARRLLDGALEVWGGNTDLRSAADPYDQFTNINQHGYTKIGESNQANGQAVFSSATKYKFYAIVSRAAVQIDTIKGSNGAYLSGSAYDAHLANYLNVGGAPDHLYGTLGSENSGNTYLGYIVIDNSANWTGMTIYTGAIKSVVLNAEFSEAANYLPGIASPVNATFKFKVSKNDASITSATFQAPSGRWYSLPVDDRSVSSTDLQYENESFTSVAAMQSEFSDGVYTVKLTSPQGTTTRQFTLSTTGSTPLAWPAAIPTVKSPTLGQTNAPADVTLSWKAITDPNVTTTTNWLADANDDTVVDNGLDRGVSSYGVVHLKPATNYTWELEFKNLQLRANADGDALRLVRRNVTTTNFRTAGGTQPLTTDLVVSSVKAGAASYHPGDSISTQVAAAANGALNPVGHSAGRFAPIRAAFRLSASKTWGAADNLTVLDSPNVTFLGGWQNQGQGPTGVIPAGTAPGTYYLGAMLDVNKVVSETNENNNIAWSTTPIIVTGKYQPSNISLSLASVAENQPVGTIIGTLSAADLDAGDRFSYSLVSGAGSADNGSFQIAGNKLKTNAVFDYETKNLYSIRVRVTDSAKLTYEKALSIKVTDAMEALRVDGTAGNDVIDLSIVGTKIHVARGSYVRDYALSTTTNVSIYGGDGNDMITVNIGSKGVLIDGGNGLDTVASGAGNDTLYGGAGADTIYGGSGNDLIYGNDGADVLHGGAGNDSLNGGLGADTLYGEDGNDSLNGGAGQDVVYAGNGDDKLYAKDTEKDVLHGEAGTDWAQVDSLDVKDGIEVLG